MTTLGQKKSISTKEDFIKSIDAMFLKLELAYHYQFYKVFGTDEKLKEGKIDDFGRLLNETWILKKKLSNKITNQKINSI